MDLNFRPHTEMLRDVTWFTQAHVANRFPLYPLETLWLCFGTSFLTYIISLHDPKSFMSVCLSDCLSLWLSVSLTVSLTACLSVCLSYCLSVRLSFCLSVWLPDWLTDWLTDWLSTHRLVCLSGSNKLKICYCCLCLTGFWVVFKTIKWGGVYCE